jgi:hypothetical protein
MQHADGIDIWTNIHKSVSKCSNTCLNKYSGAPNKWQIFHTNSVLATCPHQSTFKINYILLANSALAIWSWKLFMVPSSSPNLLARGHDRIDMYSSSSSYLSNSSLAFYCLKWNYVEPYMYKLFFIASTLDNLASPIKFSTSSSRHR